MQQKGAAIENFRTLLDFSLGRIDARTTKRKSGIDTEESLFLLMAQAHLPMPRLPDSQADEMVGDLTDLLKKTMTTD